MRWLTIVFLSSVLVMALTPVGGAESGSKPLTLDDFPDPAQYEVGSRAWFRATDALKYRPLVNQTLIDNCPHDFDVLHYNITLFIDFEYERLDGDAVVTSVSEVPDLSSVDLDFTVLTVDSVLDGGGDTLSYVYSDPVLTIDLGGTYAAGDTFDVQIFYQGQPGNEGPSGFGGFYFDGVPLMAFQMGVGLVADPPSMGKYWFPCWDWPCDKATSEYHITVPGTGRKVVCNGVLTGTEIDTLGNISTYHWDNIYEIAPHVMTVHARRYKLLVDSTYSWMYYWVFPPTEEDALIHFENCDIMMDGLIERFGPYPFDKMAYAAATKGDMEHQTCVTHINRVINPNHLYDWLLAHEMTHQWWGDCVSVNDWRDVWLSEGFATYGEALFKEHAYGMASYHSYMAASIMGPVLNSGENFPIYDPVNLWGTTTYEKGASVLHMLRHVVGDSIFYAAMAAYRQAHEYESATSAQYQSDVEGVYGQSLDWFFDEWIYDVGWPEYEYGWLAESQGDSFDLSLEIRQVQTNGPVFTMPVDVGITTVAGDTLVVLWVDEAEEAFDLVIGAEPVAVGLDPDNWILGTVLEVPHSGIERPGVAAGLRLEQNAPNPFSPMTTIHYSVPASQHVRLAVYNAAGQQVTCLVDEAKAPGWASAIWDGTDEYGSPVASGTYFCRLTTEQGRRTIPIVLVK
jgi:aminopeptidase N